MPICGIQLLVFSFGLRVRVVREKEASVYGDAGTLCANRQADRPTHAHIDIWLSTLRLGGIPPLAPDWQPGENYKLPQMGPEGEARQKLLATS